MPSSIYSTHNTALDPVVTTTDVSIHTSNGASSISPLLAHASTPRLIADVSKNYFDLSSARSSEGSSQSVAVSSPVGVQSNTMGQFDNIGSQKPSTPSTSLKPAMDLVQNTAPLVIKKKSLPPFGSDAETSSSERNYNSTHVYQPARPSSPKKRLSKDAAGLVATKPVGQTSTFAPQTPFRIITPSLETLERAMSIALFFEQYYHSLLHAPSLITASTKPTAQAGNHILNRARRLAQLEASFALPENHFMSEAERQSRRDELARDETKLLREKRRKVDVHAFEMGRVIGHGAFGVVRIAREYHSGRLVAVKQLRKAE